MAKVERDFPDMNPKSWSSHGKMSEALMRQRARREVSMMRRFGVTREVEPWAGDCRIPQKSTLVPIIRELLEFSNN